MSIYRIEHHTDDGIEIIGHTDSPAAGQADLSARAMRLIADGAMGELLLVDEASGEPVARRSLAHDADDRSTGQPDSG